MSFVQSVGTSSEVPVWEFTENGYSPEGYNNLIIFHALNVDNDYLRTMGIEVAVGSGFSSEFSTDGNSILINQALAEKLPWEDAVGNVIQRNGEHKVIGVIKDFHYAPLPFQIGPLIISQHPYMEFDYL